MEKGQFAILRFAKYKGPEIGRIEAHKDIASLDAKRAKLVDMRLEEIIDKDTYEQKYFDLSSQIEQLQKQRESLQESAETESTMKKRIAEFRRTLEENEVLDTFDRYVFESIVEKVIVGGYDENGNKDPSMLTFIYKTGFKNSLDGTNFKPPRKNSKAAKQSAGLCSHTTDEAKSMCSYHSDDTYRDCRTVDKMTQTRRKSRAGGKTMIYSRNPGKQRRYDRTDYRLEPYWIERRPVRVRRTVLAVEVPLVLGGTGVFSGRGGGPVPAQCVGHDRGAAALYRAVADCDSELEKRPGQLPWPGNLPV